MPANLLKAIHKQTGKSMQTISKDWQEAKKQVAHQHKAVHNNWAEITSIVEKETGYKPKRKK